MLKALFIFFLIGYLILKFGRFIFKYLFLMAGGFDSRNQRPTPTEGDIKVNIPSDLKDKQDFDGGEYVDYEDVK